MSAPELSRRRTYIRSWVQSGGRAFAVGPAEADRHLADVFPDCRSTLPTEISPEHEHKTHRKSTVWKRKSIPDGHDLHETNGHVRPAPQQHVSNMKSSNLLEVSPEHGRNMAGNLAGTRAKWPFGGTRLDNLYFK